MTMELYRYPPVLLGDMDPADPYQANIIYDVITAVRALDSPNYKDVSNYLNDRYSTDTIVKALRWAEKQGYIKGSGGFYRKNGGGAKKWHAYKLPPYPYTWLDGLNNARSYDDIVNMWYGLGYSLVTDGGRVVAMSKDENIAIKDYKSRVKYDLCFLWDDDTPEIPARDRYAVYKKWIRINPPLLTVTPRGAIYAPHEFITAKGHKCAKVPDCRHCVHNRGILYQLIDTWHPRILNTVLCECRPRSFNRVWHWWIACDCKDYEPWNEQFNPAPRQGRLSV